MEMYDTVTDNRPIPRKPRGTITLVDRMLGITGPPLNADEERDMALYCRYVRVMRRATPLPRLRLHFGRYGWWVTGPDGTSWNYPQAHQAVRDYQAFVHKV